MHEHPRPSRYSLSALPALEAPMWLFLLTFAHAAVTPGLPLRAISYEVDVSGSVAEIRVRQTFHAEGDQAIEATYTFPLQADAAVDGMRMLVGDRIIEGEIRDREAAKQIYAEALSTGHLAALTEQERPNVFTQRVGNIPPGADVEVDLRVGLNGSWASAILGPSEAWWLDPAVQAGAELEVAWPRRWGSVQPGVSATWASNTPATSLLPLEVLAVEPGAPEIDALPPWLFRAWVEADF